MEESQEGAGERTAFRAIPTSRQRCFIVKRFCSMEIVWLEILHFGVYLPFYSKSRKTCAISALPPTPERSSTTRTGSRTRAYGFAPGAARQSRKSTGG
jgi:hypothetical protein